MPLYGVSQPGGVLTSISPGDDYTLFDGTESPSAGVKSVAFSRGESPSGADNGTTFFIQFSSSASATVDIQSSWTDVEADYLTVYSSVFSSSTQDGYTDTGRAKFYRAILSAYSSGGMPVVKVNR